MENVELIIKISEDSYKATCNECMLPPHVKDVVQGIKNGTPIDKYEPCITMSKAFANSVASVKMLKYENEELKDKINNILTEITDTGAYELEIHGRTDFLSGINYCLDTIKKNGLTVIEADKESKDAKQ